MFGAVESGPVAGVLGSGRTPLFPLLFGSHAPRKRHVAAQVSTLRQETVRFMDWLSQDALIRHPGSDAASRVTLRAHEVHQKGELTR